jgi:bifunctional non-homologous end joining protein LigD
MLCKTIEKPFDDWLFEIKWDGYRAIGDIRNDEIRLYSRNGLDFSKSFKKLLMLYNPESMIWSYDGEIVAYDDTESLISNGCKELLRKIPIWF